MTTLSIPLHRMDKCKICGSLVPTENLPNHLLADARMLRLIKDTHPELSRQECEDHLRTLSGNSQ